MVKMPVKSVGATGLLSSACCIAMAASSLAAPICWIDRVAKAKGGIEVHFAANAVLNIGVAESADRPSRRYTASRGIVTDESGRAQDFLFVADGGEFHAAQLAEDSCSYKASANGEVGKLTAKATMRLPGLPPASATQIIATDGTVSEATSGP